MKPTQPPGAQPTGTLATRPDRPPAASPPGLSEALAGALPAWDLLPATPSLGRR